MTNKRNLVLARRYEDDGRVQEIITGDLISVLKEIRTSLLNGKLKRISHERCPLCKAEDFMVIARKDRLGLPVETLICEQCGLVFSGTYLNDSSAGLYYGKYANRFKNRGRSAQALFDSRTSPGSYAWLRYNWVREKIAKTGKEIKTVMEVGCNDGCNLLPYHKNGLEVFGCDFDEERMGPGRAAGLKLLTGGIEQLKKVDHQADLLIYSHSLEHMPNVDRALREAKDILSADGMIYIEVPGIKYWNRKRSEPVPDKWLRSGNDLLAYLQMEHNYCFEWRTLKHFAARNGLVPLIGDEFIRSLFQCGMSQDVNGAWPDKQGERVYKYLFDLEKDWQKSNPFWRRAARKIKRQFERIL